MTTKQLTIWFSTISTILVLWGIVFAFFGLDILPIVDRTALVPGESALYGAIMIGWGLTLLLIGRIAFKGTTLNCEWHCCTELLSGSLLRELFPRISEFGSM